MKRRALLAGAVAAIAATALLLGGALRSDDRASAAPTGRQLVRFGLAELEAARAGDPARYVRAERALRRALADDPEDAQTLIGLASIENSRHKFRDGLALARRAQRVSPDTALTYAAVGDSLVELGRYNEAFATFDRLAELKPGFASYSRTSYGLELLGQIQPAITAMTLAADAAGGRGEPAAFARVHLGKLHFSVGRLDAAARDYGAALRAAPGHVEALDGLARVAAARGRFDEAIRLQRQAAERSPLPQYVGALGDFYRAEAKPELAREQYDLVGAIDKLYAANGVATDLELALFNVDHGIRLRESVARARRAYSERPSIEADGVLAWALARNGRCREALRYSRRALRLGTLDAPKYFHRGMIERCLGREAEARSWFRRALRLNPHFSLVWAPVARKAVA
jgi:tetratricopeptide (TPR) repeat protein